MTNISSWGLWRSFNTVGDYFAGAFCLFLLCILLVLLVHLVRPRCYKCQQRLWFWQGYADVVFGAGPETCDTAVRHFKCKGD